MKQLRKMKLGTPTDREIVMTREFDAPRRLVFDAYTKPELLKRWLGIHDGWSFVVCEVDLKVGGSYRFLWRALDGRQLGMRGVYREVVPPERLVSTEKFDEAWYPGDAVETLVLVENEDKTTLTSSVRYDSKKTRDGVLATPMERGVTAGFDKLEEILPTLELQ